MSLNNSAITQSIGIPYQQYVTSSAGHTLVSSSTYFNDTSDNLPRYKDANGLIYDPFITSSYAVTASHALNAGGGGSTFPFTGDAEITGSLIVSGSFNAFRVNSSDVTLGDGAGNNSTINGPRNVMIGKDAGYTNTTGDDNVCVGWSAGYALSTNASDRNVFIGKLSGAGGTTPAARMSSALDNIGVGSQTLLYLNTGDDNIAIGTTAMRGSGATMSARRNIAIGRSALFYTDSGDSNIGIGYYAGVNQTTGDGNITIGSGSLGVAGESNQLRIGNGNDLVTISASLATGDIIFPSTASAAYFVGDGSQLTNLPASSTFPFTGDAEITGSLTISGSFIPLGNATDDTNVIIGKSAATNITSTSGNNVVIGNEAGGGGGTFNDADGNVCIGYQAGNGIDNGDNNVCIGYQSGYLMDGNTGVIALGWQTLRNAGNNYSVGIGDTCGRFQTNGPNTLIGGFAGMGVSGQSGGRYNAALGYRSGYLLGDGYYNVIIGGDSAGYNINDGYGNIILGTYAGKNIVDGNYNIIIGHSASLSGDVSDQLFIGSASLATISASLSTGDIIFPSTASAAYFVGDGSQLTNIPMGTSASYASTASYVETAQTASYVLNAVSSSYADTASFAQSGDGIFSGSFSGSFEGLGTNLTDVPVTTTNVLWVSTTGDNSTAQKSNVQRPWSSVSASVAAATSGDSVIVEPGTYIESPFTVGTGVTLKSLGGLKSVIVSASNNSATFITQEANTRLDGFTVVCPSGSFPGISFDNEGVGVIYDVTLKGQGNSIGCQISQSTATTSKVIYNEIRYGGGDFDKLIYVQGGIFACDGIHIPGGGNIDKIFHSEAGRLQAINTNAGNPNVSSSFYIEGGTNVILGTNLFNVQEAFHLAAQDYTINVMNSYVDDNVDKHITVDAGISGSDSSTFNIIASHMQAAKISANPDWVSSNHAFSFQDDGVTLDPAFRTYSDLEVGHANKGFTTGMGEGLPYNKGMEIWASGSGGVSQSLTEEVLSKEDSTFEFSYSASGDMMYFGNKQKSPDIADAYLYFTGLQYKQVTTGSLSFGDLTLEIFTTASTWEAIDGAQVVSSVEGYNYANNIFLHENSQEEIIANVNTEVWATSSIFGIEARWGRIRLLSSLTESPTFEQFLYTPNTTLVNPKGITSFRGKALFRDTLLAAGNVFGESGNVVDANITVGTGTSNPPQTWDHNFKNSLMNSNGDAVYLNLTIPKGTCTAFPLKTNLYYHSSAGGSNDIDMYISALPVQVAGIKINDPNGGKVPVPRTVASTTSVTADNAQVTTFTNIDNTTGIFHKITSDDIDISSYYEGDVILIRVELDNDGADNSDIAVVGIEVSAVKWSLGERT